MGKNTDNYIFTEKKDEIKKMVQLFVRTGLIEDENIAEERIRKAKQSNQRRVYHNTELMLKQYRNLAWVLETFPEEISDELEQPFENIDKLISRLDVEMAYGNRRLEHRLEGITQARLIIDRINVAVDSLKRYANQGELLYQLIYQSYISPERLIFTEVANRLDISERHYYRLRATAFKVISNRLWNSIDKNMNFWIEMLVILTTK